MEDGISAQQTSKNTARTRRFPPREKSEQAVLSIFKDVLVPSREGTGSPEFLGVVKDVQLKPGWEVAKTRLENYFDRNLDQLRSIFYLGVGVMIVGFLFVLYGINRSLADPRDVAMSIVAAGAGVITQFIGATFMLIYRSTLQQASSYMEILERINSVGMAVFILDTISGNDHDRLTDSTKAEMVKILFGAIRRGSADTSKRVASEKNLTGQVRTARKKRSVKLQSGQGTK